jgi:hypothetical protein
MIDENALNRGFSSIQCAKIIHDGLQFDSDQRKPWPDRFKALKAIPPAETAGFVDV